MVLSIFDLNIIRLKNIIIRYSVLLILNCEFLGIGYVILYNLY